MDLRWIKNLITDKSSLVSSKPFLEWLTYSQLSQYIFTALEQNFLAKLQEIYQNESADISLFGLPPVWS